MSYIYKITNDINNKIYIGQTSRSIQERWKEHINSYKIDTLNRPLYNAMKKYGKEHFHIELIEECDNKIVSEREQFWIYAYNSYYEGYNATIGGDGRSIVDSSIVYNLFNQGKLVKEIVELTGYSKPTVSKILDAIDENKKIRLERNHKITSKPVVMLDKDTEKELMIFNSINAARIFCGGKASGLINAVCKGKRKTAYGYKWRYLES